MNNQLGDRLMPKKHHAIYSDPTGAAAAASPVRRAPRTKRAETPVDGKVSAAPEGVAQQETFVDREAVARLAYSYWEARGFTGGSPEEDWLRAEREIRESAAANVIA
jgi:hypothetical protein